jgi:hypothetical protein
MLVIFLPALPAALKPYKEKNEKQKTYLNDETRISIGRNGWKEYGSSRTYRDEKRIDVIPEEEIVRRVFVDTPNATIVAGLRKSELGKQEGVLQIIRYFEVGRKFSGWSANGYYARAAIDRKLVDLCRRVNFRLLDQAKRLISPSFFLLYNWVRRDCPAPTLIELEQDAPSMLKQRSIRAIVRVLQEHPEEKNRVMLAMLHNVFPCMRHKCNIFSKMFDKKMRAICEKAGFEQWLDIPRERLTLGEATRTAAIRAFAQSHPEHLTKIVLKTYQDLLFYDSVPPQAPLIIEQGLLEAPSLALYTYQHMYLALYHFEKRSLLGDYIYFKHRNIQSGDLFFKVLHRPSDEQFKEIWDNLRKVPTFQSALYVMSVSHLQSDDERLKIIHDAALEIQSRIKRWADMLNVNAHVKCCRVLQHVYSDIVHAAIDKAAKSHDEQTRELLLDIFRSAHRFNECQQVCYSKDRTTFGFQDENFGVLLLRLIAMGVKADTLLCPDDPEDKRTLLSSYIFSRLTSSMRMGEWVSTALKYAQSVWEQLSDAERAVEMMRWAELPEFASQFERYCALFQERRLVDESLGHIVGAIMHLGSNVKMTRTSLLERLLTDV